MCQSSYAPKNFVKAIGKSKRGVFALPSCFVFVQPSCQTTKSFFWHPIQVPVATKDIVNILENILLTLSYELSPKSLKTDKPKTTETYSNQGTLFVQSGDALPLSGYSQLSIVKNCF